MKSHTSAITLIAIASHWVGCTSPKSQTSENLPSQLPANPIDLHPTPTLETGELAGEPGVEGLPGQPVAEGIVLPGDSYTPPDIDFANLKDIPPEERSLDTPRVRDPEEWKPENILTPPGATGEEGEPEKIVLLEDSDRPDLDPELAAADQSSDEKAAFADESHLDHLNPFSPELASLLTAPSSFPSSPQDGEASAIPVFFPSDPSQLKLDELLQWLDHQDIQHPEHFADTSEALLWLKQRRESELEGSGDRNNKIDQLFAWLTSSPSDQHGGPQMYATSFTGTPWNFSQNDPTKDSSGSNPLMLSKAALWLQNPDYQQAPSQPSASITPSNPFQNRTSLQASRSTNSRSNLAPTSFNYTATLRWLQLASQKRSSASQPVHVKSPASPPTLEHQEALRWLQKASGKRAPLHASVLSSGVLNP